MDTLMFFYTQAILVICIVTAVLSLAAYASSRRRFFIYGSGVFICYAIEMTEIFFFEYTLQKGVRTISWTAPRRIQASCGTPSGSATRGTS